MTHPRILSPSEVPLLDLEDVRSGDPGRRATYFRDLERTLQSFGFLLVTGHGMELGLIDRCYGLPESEAVPLALVMNEIGTNAIKHRASRSDGIMVRVSGRPDGMVFEIENPGQLPAGFDLAQIAASVSGLGLVKALLPRRGAKLTLEQSGAMVAARLQLFPPSIREDSV